MTIKVNNSLERAVKEILSEYEEAQINLASDFSQTLLAKKICNKIRQRYHVFRINELIADGIEERENDHTRLQ